jgi:hypothetical protein
MSFGLTFPEGYEELRGEQRKTMAGKKGYGKVIITDSRIG